MKMLFRQQHSLPQPVVFQMHFNTWQSVSSWETYYLRERLTFAVLQVIGSSISSALLAFRSHKDSGRKFSRLAVFHICAQRNCTSVWEPVKGKRNMKMCNFQELLVKH